MKYMAVLMASKGLLQVIDKCSVRSEHEGEERVYVVSRDEGAAGEDLYRRDTLQALVQRACMVVDGTLDTGVRITDRSEKRLPKPGTKTCIYGA